ncbi:MAG: hypoxanthine phosphoribosyltransferase [Verrucomicrobia bacterium]|nr:hypoxanthine phosphoribosyltransferase [Verrucomicrobiota bacterium]
MKAPRIPIAAPGRTLPPPALRPDIESVLLSPERIRRRVARLGDDLTREFSGRELVVVAMLHGTVVFLADLLRHLPLPLQLDFLAGSSYRSGTRPGVLRMTRELRLDVRGREVLIVDDILDTGRTLEFVRDRIARLRPAGIRTCVLLDKPSRRERPIQADHVGFQIPDVFVVGYGMDHDERFRNLPFVGVRRITPLKGDGG